VVTYSDSFGKRKMIERPIEPKNKDLISLIKTKKETNQVELSDQFDEYNQLDLLDDIE
jgi:hypothetical protein